MKRTNGNFEKLSSLNFYTLSTAQKHIVRGGAGTAGGSKQDGQQTRVIIDGKEYRSTPMRCWDSDSVNSEGVTCYDNETVTNVLTPY